MIDLHKLDQYRVIDPRMGWAGDENHGAFEIPLPMPRGYRFDRGSVARCIASSGFGWDHVSVSVNTRRCPVWEEMEFIRRKFFHDHEAVMQYHPVLSEYIDGENGTGHPFVLHLWRPYDDRINTIPVPPRWMIGGDPVRAQREMQEAIAAGFEAK